MDDGNIVPVQPTREALRALRDREASARLELEACRHIHIREAMAMWMLLDGASVRARRRAPCMCS